MSFQAKVQSLLGSAQSAASLHAGLTAKQALLAKQEEANKKAEQVKKAKTEQKTRRRNFMRDYLAKQETSLGGTVGELPLAMQKQIASQYSKSQRKQMMDLMDREAKDGK